MVEEKAAAMVIVAAANPQPETEHKQSRVIYIYIVKNNLQYTITTKYYLNLQSFQLYH